MITKITFMNFLAHAYLSFDDPDLIVGNIIADMIKGKQINQLPSEIQQGVVLHRQIDTFTDKHPIVKETKVLFDKSAGRYNGLFLDVAFDHFLAVSEEFEPEIGWEVFTQNCYQALESRSSFLPSQFISMFMYMKSENWLLNYRNKWLIEKSFERLQNRASYLPQGGNIYSDFELHYNALAEGFNNFYPDLIEYVKTIK